MGVQGRIWCRQRASAVVVLAVFSMGCSRPEPGSSAPYFFVDHVEEAEAHVEDRQISPPRLVERLALGYETRRSLAPPLPSRLSYRLQLPEASVLRFAIGASTMGNPTLLAPVSFRVLVDDTRGEVEVFREVVRRSQPNRWQSHHVDLARWAGREARITFETTRAPGGVPSAERHILPVWGNPVLSTRASSQPRDHRLPDIILISIDCLRADHVGVYGYQRDTTPNLDAFARQSAVFRDAVSASGYTLPTHASMLTGVPPSIHGATRAGLRPSVPYLPAFLAQEGYRVNGMVSAPYLAPAYGFDRGFHTYKAQLKRAEALVDDALAMIRESEGQRQFLFLHLMDAHWTYSPPAAFISRFGDRPADITQLLEIVGESGAPSELELQQIIALYDAEIAYVDAQLGRLFEALKSMGRFEDALILVTADHGEAFYDHQYWEHPRPWLNEGPGLYQEIVHVPLIVKWPRDAAPAEVDTVVSQMDIFATILKSAGLDRHTPWSLDLKAHLESDAAPEPRMVLTEFLSIAKDGNAALRIALRNGASKYMATFRSSDASALYATEIDKEELYDLAADPREQTNKMLEGSVSVGEFRRALRDHAALARQRDLGPNPAVVPDATLLEELKTLGYIEP